MIELPKACFVSNYDSNIHSHRNIMLITPYDMWDEGLYPIRYNPTTKNYRYQCAPKDIDLSPFTIKIPTANMTVGIQYELIQYVTENNIQVLHNYEDGDYYASFEEDALKIRLRF